jgi:RNA polymerase sigma factor (sigma-70 family)
MNAARPAEILRQLEQTGPADAGLLARFVATKDAAAFAELVRRHGALVMGVCRRVTGHPQDAEDAFQATFLVLAQKAGALRAGVRLWSWLYGVAFRVAWRARRSASRRRAREVTVTRLPEPHAPPPPRAMPELTPILDEELAALPECYREAIVLCDLRGVSREEAAAALGIPEGTLSSRLANGRKKLAARLTKRGVTLSVTALPIAIAEAQAGTTVPTELVSTTCGRVADFAANGAVPASLARLIEGGFAMRKILVFGLVMVAAVTGAVFAARPGEDAPPVDPPTAPAVAEKTAEQPKPKEEPKAGEKATFTTAPRLAAGWDIAVADVGDVAWSPDGTTLAVVGADPADKRSALFYLLKYPAGSTLKDRVRTGLPRYGNFVGFSTDGKHVLTDLREFGLLSGYHKLHYWDPTKAERNPVGGPPTTPRMLGGEAKVRSVDLDAGMPRGYALPADGKTFRTMREERDDKGRETKMEVLEVDAVSGKTGRSLLKLDHSRGSVLSRDGSRLAVRDENLTKVTVYDVDRGAKLSEHTFPAEKLVMRPRFSSMMFSEDGRRLVVARGVGQTFVVNTDTGAGLPALDGLPMELTMPHAQAFSGDGRLLALACRKYQEEKKGVGGAFKPSDLTRPEYLTVWDTQTGKVLKMWPGSPRVAFSPTRPLLAIVEPNGETETRIGFWDFAAEVEKK